MGLYWNNNWLKCMVHYFHNEWMDHLPTTMASCFVCDTEVTEGVFMAVAETFFTKTVFATKISHLVGSDFVVIAREDDQLCRRCASLLNKSDKLEVDLMEINNVIKRSLDFKYNLISKEDNCSEAGKEGLERSKEVNDSADLEFMIPELSALEALISRENDKNTTLYDLKNDDSKEHASTSNITSRPTPCDKEENVKLCKDQCTQISLSDTEMRGEIKQEHNIVGHTINTSQSGESVTLDETGNTTELILNNENHVYLLDERVYSREEKSNVKTDEKYIEIKTEADEPSKKIKPLLPKVVKSETDLLQLASLCIFEPIDGIITLNKFENDESVEQYIEVESANIDNDIVHDATPKRNVGRTMIKHKRDLINVEVFKCDQCNKECTSKNRLDMHKTIHEKKICDYCGRGFNSRYRLKVHQNIHTRQKKFVCTVCGESFIHHSTYWYHRKWHDEPFPYSCEYCGRRFKHSSMLAVHRRKHTGERPYKCSYCPDTFTISTTLKKHELLHTREYPFNCNLCSMGFSTHRKFSYHMVKMHKDTVKAGDVPNERTRNVRVKSEKKEESDSNTNQNCEQVDGELLVQYLPVELSENGVEKMKKYKDISIEVINKEKKPELVEQQWVVHESVDIGQDLPIELDEGVYEIVLGPDEIVLSEEMIIPDNLITEEMES